MKIYSFLATKLRKLRLLICSIGVFSKIMLSILLVNIFVFKVLAIENNIVLQDYVKNLIAESYRVLEDSSKPMAVKKAECEVLLDHNLDTPWMAKFTLGKFRKNSTPEQQTDYIETYRAYVIRAFSNNIKSFNNQQIIIKNVQKLNDNEFAINTFIKNRSDSNIKIDFLVRSYDNGHFKIFDIVTEGISLINSHQAEFANIINNKGIDGLIIEIKTKTENIK